MSRESRPTIRCLTDDLGIELPDIDVCLGDIDHPWLNELRRIADTSPLNQKRILCIAYPMVYRLRISNMRGATWVEDAQSIVWLCAVHRREQGSDDDAFEWFADLHGQGSLLPCDDDHLRYRAEAVIRLHRELSAALCALADEALQQPSVELTSSLCDWLPCRILVLESAGMQEIWCAISVLDVDGGFASERQRELLFAELERYLKPFMTEARIDWPAGELLWHEAVRLGLREIH